MRAPAVPAVAPAASEALPIAPAASASVVPAARAPARVGGGVPRARKKKAADPIPENPYR
jgi:hypothetical protein